MCSKFLSLQLHCTGQFSFCDVYLNITTPNHISKKHQLSRLFSKIGTFHICEPLKTHNIKQSLTISSFFPVYYILQNIYPFTIVLLDFIHNIPSLIFHLEVHFTHALASLGGVQTMQIFFKSPNTASSSVQANQ